MKLKCKIFLAITTVVLCAFIQKALFAVGNVYQAIYNYAEKDEYLIYRTLVKPYPATLKSFPKYNTWYYNYDEGESTPNPSYGSYATENLIFTKGTIGSYDKGNYTQSSEAIKEIGYATFNITIPGYQEFVSGAVSDVNKWTIDGVGEHVKGVMVTDGFSSEIAMYTYGYQSAASPTITSTNFTQEAFNAYNDNTIDTGKTKVFSNLLGSVIYKIDGYNYIKPYKNNTYSVSGISPRIVYREMLYTTKYSGTPNADKHDTTKIYVVMDLKLKSDIVEALRTYKNGDENKKIYVSSIVCTKDLYSGGTIFYALTPGAFVHAKGRSFTGDGWTTTTLGATNNGLGSGLNLWDNELLLPESASSSKNIVVNHIAVNIDEAGKETFKLIETKEETLNIKNSSDEAYNLVDKLYRNDSDNTVTTASTKDGKELKKVLISKTTTNNNLMQYTIRGLNETINYKVTRLTTLDKAYTYVGYVVDKNAKIDTVNLEYFKNKFELSKFGDPIFDMEKLQNEVIVNMYYQVETKNVVVEHKVCKDVENNIECGSIAGNKEITIFNPQTKKETTIKPVSDQTYIERYSRINRDYYVIARKNNNYTYNYKGYKYTIDGEEHELTDADECRLEGNQSINITFYYQTDNPVLSVKEAPTKDIPGTLTVKSAVGVDTTCVDEGNGYYSFPTRATNNEPDVLVGIKNTPTYILAGINVANKSEEGEVKINVTIKFGNQEKNISLHIPYNWSYYVIQDLLLYKYNRADIFDAGQSNTKGASLLNTNKFSITPKNYSTLNHASSYLNRYVSINYSIPTDSLDNTKETILINDGRTNKTFSLIDSATLALGYDTATTHTISDYVSVTYTDKEGKSIEAETLKEYAKLAIDGEINMTINFLDKKIFEKIDVNKDEIVDDRDLKSFENNTDNAAKEFEDSKGKYEIANDDSKNIKEELNELHTEWENSKYTNNEYCKDKGDFDECKTMFENTQAAFQRTLNVLEDNSSDIAEKEADWKNSIKSGSGETCVGCESEEDKEAAFIASCNSYIDAINVGEYKKPTVPAVPKAASEKTCRDDLIDKYKAAIKETEDKLVKIQVSKETFETNKENYENACTKYGSTIPCKDKVDLSSQLTNATNEYKDKLAALKNAYNNELVAIKEYDEVKWIQDTLWKTYNNATAEVIAKYIGLNIKFEYASEYATLGGTELVTLDSKSTSTELTSDSIDTLTKIELNAAKPYLNKKQKEYYTSGISVVNYIDYEKEASEYYEGSTQVIPITKLNGRRVLAANAYYGIDNQRIGTSSVVRDNMYYDGESLFEVTSNSTYVKKYGVKQNEEVAEKQKTDKTYNAGRVNSEEFNVYTPLEVTAEIISESDVINQLKGSAGSSSNVIQANTPFTVKFTNGQNNVKYSNKKSDFTSRYRQATYIKFEFAVKDVKYSNASGKETSYGSFDAMKWIGPIYGDTITAVPNIVNFENQIYNYYVIAAAVNANESWTKQLLAFVNTSLDDLTDETLVATLKNACGVEGNNKLSYYADIDTKPKDVAVVNRVYDFRVTDLKDLDWKNVFRNSSTNVNVHSGIAYYSGLKKWIAVDNANTTNNVIGRTPEEIGDTATRILPLGPYKNTDTTYISAPKMGYRFSFDLKVTGVIDDNDGKGSQKKVVILPSFYYISKDGKTFYSQYNSSGEEIYLFYKNSAGQYVRIGSENDKYKIQFTPNDGYRSLITTENAYLSSKVVTLGDLKKLVLKPDETTTRAESTKVITYYGEYKLPNSTIAVKVDKSGKYDINKPLTGGYIGVVFDIRAYETDSEYLLYGKDAYKGKQNTSQWDYEGYLGISNPGNSYTTTLKLEKGTWKIDNTTYNKIKGTVILYDTDSKASSDFN